MVDWESYRTTRHPQLMHAVTVAQCETVPGSHFSSAANIRITLPAEPDASVISDTKRDRS